MKFLWNLAIAPWENARRGLAGRNRASQTSAQPTRKTARVVSQFMAGSCDLTSAHSKYEQLVELVYDAVFDDSAWMPMAATLEEVLGITGSHLGLVDAARTDPRLVFSRLYIEGAPAPDVEALYVGEYFPIDERLPRFHSLPLGKPVHNREIYTADEMRRTSATYNDFLLPLDGANQLVVRLPHTGSDHDAWVLTRAGSRDYDPDQVELTRRIAKHVGRLVRMRRELSRIDAVGSTLNEVLEHATAAIFLLDGAGRIHECNAHARDLLGRQGTLTDCGGRLGSSLSTADRAVRGAIRRAGSASDTREASSVRVPAPGEGDSLWMHVSPVPRNAAAPLSNGVEVLAVVHVPWRVPPLDRAGIRARLGLTALEAEVAALLAEGRTVAEIASRRQRTVESVRWHLKQIFGKTGLRRQADLVRVVLSAAGKAGA